MKNKYFPEIAQNGLAVLAGILLTLACAPFKLFPLGILSAAIMLSLWLDVTPATARKRGFFYGLGLFGSGVYWIYISMHTYANLPVWGAAGLTCLFVALLSLFPAYQGSLFCRFLPRTNNSKILCAFPAIWVFVEWIRSWIFTGFPWLFLGYSQTNSPLKGYAPLLSVYGVSLATALSGALLYNALRYWKAGNKKNVKLNLLLLAVIWLIGAASTFTPWTTPIGKPLKVSLVQANIPQQLKWLPEQVEPTLLQYKLLTEDHWDSQLIIWPEAAVPAPLNDVQDFVNEMRNDAKKHQATLLMGIPVQQEEGERYYNGVISLNDNDIGYYYKHRLVPFGEYMPMEKQIGRYLSFLDIPMSQLVESRVPQKPITLPSGVRLLTTICFEIAFPELVARSLHDIGLILTVTNDAWFGHSIAQAQHLQIAQMRALETGRPLLFASNNGITAMISPQGKLTSKAKPFKTTVLTGMIQPYSGLTPWTLYPMDPILLIISMLFYTALRNRKA